MNKNIVINYTITNDECKIMGVNRIENLNGIYFYNDYKQHKQGILINMSSYEFFNLTESEIITQFTKVDTHEMIHYLIHNITNTKTSWGVFEEKVALIMANQK